MYNHYVDGKKVAGTPLRETAGPPSLRQLLEQNAQPEAASCAPAVSEAAEANFAPVYAEVSEAGGVANSGAGLASMLRPIVLPMLYDRIAKLKDEELLLLAAVLVIA
ncbi:MAG: hypothetical protein LBN97_05055 [Oscillospiraceae bacterium]|nr:hypothetical protein [Oscillospiraceae bacterium]